MHAAYFYVHTYHMHTHKHTFAGGTRIFFWVTLYIDKIFHEGHNHFKKNEMHLG